MHLIYNIGTWCREFWRKHYYTQPPYHTVWFMHLMSFHVHLYVCDNMCHVFLFCFFSYWFLKEFNRKIRLIKYCVLKSDHRANFISQWYKWRDYSELMLQLSYHCRICVGCIYFFNLYIFDSPHLLVPLPLLVSGVILSSLTMFVPLCFKPCCSDLMLCFLITKFWMICFLF